MDIQNNEVGWGAAGWQTQFGGAEKWWVNDNLWTIHPREMIFT